MKRVTKVRLVCLGMCGWLSVFPLFHRARSLWV